MSSTPYFSIIIPTYNSFEKLTRALKSLQNQTFQNFEVIIIDDGSTDKTPHHIAEILFSKVHYIYKENGGTASARNIGIEHAKGHYICFLDADDEFMYDKLSEYYRYCKKNKLFLISDALFIDENIQTEYLFSSQTQIYEGNSFVRLIENNFIVTSTVCIQSTLLSQKPYFIESCFIEDYDLWLKIAQYTPITYIPKALTRYYIHGSNQSKNAYKTIQALITLYFKWSFISLSAFKQLCKYVIVFFVYNTGLKK